MIITGEGISLRTPTEQDMDDPSRVLVSSSSDKRDPMTPKARFHPSGADCGGAAGETVDLPIERESGSHTLEDRLEKDPGDAESELQGNRNGDGGPGDPWTDARDAARDVWLRVRKS